MDELPAQKCRLVKNCVSLLEEKRNGSENNTMLQEKLLMPVNKINVLIAICIALNVFFLKMHRAGQRYFELLALIGSPQLL